jgi:HD-GYP domain-containing protein (c-di-GMP phosphodiesterase class II)
VLEAFADFVDLKSPYTLGHSPGVARLAAAAGEVVGLDAEWVERLRRAGLVHDLGRRQRWEGCPIGRRSRAG